MAAAAESALFISVFLPKVVCQVVLFERTNRPDVPGFETASSG